MPDTLPPTERLLAEDPGFSCWWFLARAYHSFASQTSRFFEEQGITGAQYGVLRCLYEAGDAGLMLSELSKRLMVTCGNTTGVVDRLEQAGYLRRERCSDDRRVVWARLTPEGEAVYTRVMPAYYRLVRELTSGLTPDENAALGKGCEKLHLAIEEGKQNPE